ncbi:ThuA domain-containing protein [Cohnella sp.]|uniref:ThuA domain-containing protein n=1 Tax=Cohnella sp. TaxID=1883426 RepID=UPI003567E145
MFNINIRSQPSQTGFRKYKNALILQGGYPPHRPKEVAEILARLLRQQGNFKVEISNTLDSLLDREKLRQTDLIIPNWTAGTITEEQLRSFLDAVSNGTGVAGMHGGMGDAFRCEIDYQLMVGGQFVAHPGGAGITYEVHITHRDHPIMAGIRDFMVTTEQYYMLVDPANEVLATTYFNRVHPPEVWREVVMPVVWTKKYGKGRIFYCSLGHSLDIVTMPEVLTMMKRGMVWAAR